MLLDGEIESDLITEINLFEDSTEQSIITLLYYFGYLTIKEKNIFTNKLVFEEYIKEIVLKGKISKITDYVEKLMELSSNKIYIEFNKKYLHLLYVTLLLRNKLVKVYDEFQCGNEYADLMIKRNHELAKFDILVELKYIKKSDYTEDLLKEKREEVESQLNEYEKAERISKDHLRKYIVIFSGSNLFY